MSARSASPTAAAGDAGWLGVLRALLLLETAAGLAGAIGLSILAGNDPANEIPLRFAAAASLFFGLFAAIASRGVRRRRGWSWTMGAVLQVLLALGTGIAILVAPWHPAMLAGFALPVLIMLVLSVGSVRGALGQGD